MPAHGNRTDDVQGCAPACACAGPLPGPPVCHAQPKENVASEDAWPVLSCGSGWTTLRRVRNPFVRSKLFVPGARPDLFSKAMASGADAVSFDLEDAVSPDLKPAARAHVACAIRQARELEHCPLLIVRVNGPTTPWYEDDLQAMAAAGPDWINLPKVSSVEGVRRAATTLAQAEEAAGRRSPIRLLLNIETATALQQAAALAAADQRTVGLQLGLADLFEPLGMDRNDEANVHAAMFALRMAAASANVLSYDAAYPRYKDADGFLAEARMARRLGFAGKTCIHPLQVPLANDVFGPTPEELAHARRMVAAADAAGASESGVFSLDGVMVDLPYLQRARAVLASATAQSGTAGS